MISDSWNHRQVRSIQRNGGTVITVGDFCAMPEPMVLVQSTLSASKDVDCNLSDHLHLFMLFCHQGRNEILRTITSHAKCSANSLLLPGGLH